MLPGTKHTPEDLVRILLRRWWMILLPVMLSTTAAVVWSKRLPDQYRSETLIMLLPQRIPESYVKATVTQRIEDRLGTLSDQILSRSRLERIIVDLDLYQQQRRNGVMQDVVDRMRNEIKVTVEGKESFRVSYVSGEAVTAQKVTDRLASLFIEENLRDRENVAEDTNRFLDSQLEDAKRRLIEQERKLEAYRRRYSGQLPSQVQVNLQAIQNAEMQRRALEQNADRERERRIQLESQLAESQMPEPVAPAPLQARTAGAPTVDDLGGGTVRQQLEVARETLKLLELRNTPDHPDVRILKRRIRDLEEQVKNDKADPATEKPASAAAIARERRIRDIKATIEAVDRRLRDIGAEEAQLVDRIRGYQAKVDAVPTRESELVELTRDYATLQTSYESLLAKREDSKIAANLERRNIGEHFRILDAANIPERPFSPDRRQIALIGFGVGLVFALGLVGLLEYLDSTFKREEDIVRTLSMPVLAVVPIIAIDSDHRRQRWRLIFIGMAAAVVVAASAALGWWTLRS